MYCVWHVVKTPTIISNNPVEAYHRDTVAQFEFHVCFKGFVLVYDNELSLNEHCVLCDNIPKVDNTSEVNEENASVAATNESDRNVEAVHYVLCFVNAGLVLQ